jgi:hypothetical protein
VFLFSKTTA